MLSTFEYLIQLLPLGLTKDSGTQESLLGCGPAGIRSDEGADDFKKLKKNIINLLEINLIMLNLKYIHIAQQLII